MPVVDDPEEKLRRAIAVAEMLHFIAEGLLEGVWTNFKFNVRQHRTELRKHGRLVHAGPAKLDITFSMDVDEEAFKADMAKRQREVNDALKIIDEKGGVNGLLIEHEDNSDEDTRH